MDWFLLPEGLQTLNSILPLLEGSLWFPEWEASHVKQDSRKCSVCISNSKFCSRVEEEEGKKKAVSLGRCSMKGGISQRDKCTEALRDEIIIISKTFKNSAFSTSPELSSPNRKCPTCSHELVMSRWCGPAAETIARIICISAGLLTHCSRAGCASGDSRWAIYQRVDDSITCSNHVNCFRQIESPSSKLVPTLCHHCESEWFVFTVQQLDRHGGPGEG